MPVCFSSTGNPGGVGQAAVKRRYIDPAPGGWQIIKERDEFTGLISERIYIPSRITDNQLLLRNDPGYLARLAQTGSEALVKAWLDGDFDAVEGAFFHEWSQFRHVIGQCPLPAHWTRFRSMDWGSFYPFYVGWFAYAAESWLHPSGKLIPQGSLILYREIYGSKANNNVGLKLPADVVGRMIAQNDLNDKIAYGVLDPSAFKQDGGPGNAERMARATEGRVFFRKADNARTGKDGAMGGWDEMRSRLRGIEIKGSNDTLPTLYIMDNCPTPIRIIPLAQHKKDHLEDLEIPEAHCLDAIRYGCMSRPWGQPLPPPMGPLRDIRDATFDELVREKIQRDKRSKKEYI